MNSILFLDEDLMIICFDKKINFTLNKEADDKKEEAKEEKAKEEKKEEDDK